MIKTSISVLFFGRPDVSGKFLTMLGSTLLSRNDVEIIIRDNGCVDNGESMKLIFNCGLKNLVYVPSGINVGFARGHNLNLELARGQYFIVLNNDIFFNDTRWLDKLVYPLEANEDLKLVGLQGAPSVLAPVANSTYVTGKIGSRLDYIEGSCLAGRVGEFKEYGLFSKEFVYGYFEDGDLSMRFKQMGLPISVVRVSHKHIRGSSLSQIHPEKRHEFANRNCEIFKKRWGSYMQNHSFVNRINVIANSLGIGDVMCMTPVLGGLRRIHPTAIIEVTTPHPDVFMGNPHLSALYEMKRAYKGAYDRIIDLKPNYGSMELIGQECARIAGVEVDSYIPEIFLSQLELEAGRNVVDSLRESDDSIVTGVQLRNSRPDWHGKCYSHEATGQLITRLGEAGIRTIELGKDIEPTGLADMNLVNELSLREYFSVVANLDLMITIDSLGLHVAQTFGIPTFCLFGATNPLAYVLDWESVFPIFREDLDCVFCYQRKGKPDFNRCAVGSEECMNISPEAIMEHVAMERDRLLAGNIRFLQKHIHFHTKYVEF